MVNAPDEQVAPCGGGHCHLSTTVCARAGETQDFLCKGALISRRRLEKRRIKYRTYTICSRTDETQIKCSCYLVTSSSEKWKRRKPILSDKQLKPPQSPPQAADYSRSLLIKSVRQEKKKSVGFDLSLYKDRAAYVKPTSNSCFQTLSLPNVYKGCAIKGA